MSRTIHRFDGIYTIFRFRGEHVFLVVVPVTGLFPKRAIQNLRPLHFLIAIVLIHLAHVLFHLLPDRPALGVPENQTWSFILKMEQVQRTSQATMIPLFSFFQHMQIGVLVFLLGQAVP